MFKNRKALAETGGAAALVPPQYGTQAPAEHTHAKAGGGKVTHEHEDATVGHAHPDMALLPLPAAQIRSLVEGSKAGGAGNPQALIEWYETGEGADQIDWGTPGDHERCVELASKYMSEEQAHGFCQLREMSVTGQTTSQHAAEERRS
jgi:hypothetical protein